MNRILVIEDELDIRELILLHLKRESYAAEFVENGEDGLTRLTSAVYNLIIVDWMLPNLSGIEVCKRVRLQLIDTPILMLTARADPNDIVRGLEAGADDYVTKPFEVSVLLARVKALLRRSPKAELKESHRLEVGNLVLDLSAHKLSCRGEEIQLTISEFKLLAALLDNRGRVLSRERLIDLVQGQDVVVVDRTIDTHIFGLRKKMGACADVIETVRGVGYRVKSE